MISFVSPITISRTSKKMANVLLLFTIIITVLSIEIRAENDSDIQFVCGRSKHIKKCGCWQETDRFEHIPLFNIDCSRLEFKSNPTTDELPFLMGHLDLSHNKISNLNDSNKLNSETLYFFDLSYNRIKTIAQGFFAGLTQLQQLNLGHNKIDILEKEMFEGLSHLKVLNIEANKFKVLKTDIFSPLIHLEDLSLSHNYLGLFICNNGLSNYLPKKLKHLYLESIYLKTINSTLFKDMERLKKLSIANNPIQELPRLNLNNLEYLDISSTNVSNITQQSLFFLKLKVLKMNRLLYLTTISEYAFYNIPHLEELYIEHCIRLQEIKVVLRDIKSENKTNVTLTKIHLNHNKLISLPHTFEPIFQEASEIYLADNKWHCDCKISWMRNLRKNIKDYNQIRCKSPETEVNKTFASLEKQLPCLETKSIEITIYKYKPIQSWLFPTIGILSLIVICLLAVLLYLGPYGSTKYKANVKYFGPNSPYNQITIIPNQAEI